MVVAAPEGEVLEGDALVGGVVGKRQRLPAAREKVS